MATKTKRPKKTGNTVEIRKNAQTNPLKGAGGGAGGVKVPTSMVCAVCQVSPQLVRKYRGGQLTGNGTATLRVQVAEMLLSEKLPALLNEVERLLPPVVRTCANHTTTIKTRKAV